jgi:hypothetical protein
VGGKAAGLGVGVGAAPSAPVRVQANPPSRTRGIMPISNLRPLELGFEFRFKLFLLGMGLDAIPLKRKNVGTFKRWDV